MKITFKGLLVLSVLIFTLTNNIIAEANGLTPTDQPIFEGYTSDGIHYLAYLSDVFLTSSPQIVTSKKYSIDIILDGNVIPSKTWNTYITEDNITYSGTLYLQSYSYDNFFKSKKTIAHYSGSLFAVI